MDLINKLNLKHKLKRSKAVLTSFTNNKISVEGEVVLPVDFAGQKTHFRFVVSSDLDTDILIGLNFLQKFGMVLNMATRKIYSAFGSTDYVNNPKPTNHSSKVK